MRLAAGLLLLGLAGCGDREAPPARSVPAASPRMPATVPAPAPPEAHATEVVMDVTRLVGKSEDEVAALLGPPTSCENIHRARLCKYPPDGNEVMFVAGRADMITVQGMDAVAFGQEALLALGLEPTRPDHSNERAIRWESIPDLQEVTVFAGEGDRVRYAYVKVGKH